MISVSAVYFQHGITIQNCAGILMTTVGVGLYTYTKKESYVQEEVKKVWSRKGTQMQRIKSGGALALSSGESGTHLV